MTSLSRVTSEMIVIYLKIFHSKFLTFDIIAIYESVFIVLLQVHSVGIRSNERVGLWLGMSRGTRCRGRRDTRETGEFLVNLCGLEQPYLVMAS